MQRTTSDDRLAKAIRRDGRRRAYDRAAKQYGVVTTQRLGKAKARNASARGEVVSMYRGVHRFRVAGETFASRAHAAIAAAQHRSGSGFGSRTGRRVTLAAISHRSALHVYGLDGGSTTVIEIVCGRWDRTRHPGVKVHEMRQLGANDIRFEDGLPVVTPELALLQLAAKRWSSIDAVERAVYAARRKRLASIESLELFLQRKARRGRPGVRKLRAALALARRHELPPESDPEAMLLQTCRARGLGEPQLQFSLVHDGRTIGRFDGAFPEIRVLFEYQSMAYHQNEDELARANERQLAAFAAGWIVLEVRWWDLKNGGRAFARAITAARTRASGP